ncbi:hypothetical protein D6850_07160 [Roseovarius spongiae]|uniref:Lipoprotein n=1 Tax=Roseovarius spongiae TaxID=2320272 RepID=A0A3A8B951_9RHOB|nr:hypothetical protein [Roseovarius spongiae]RKF14655.1 hypothetical protein D6850_07160 [Roseovarius spongiae]
MIRVVLLILVMVLAGCDAPSPEFRGIAPHRVEIGLSRFDVRVSGARAEAIRVNGEWAPRLAATAPGGVAAIERVSRCKVRRLRGDQAMMTADLDCGGAPRPLPPERPKYLDCGSVDLDEGSAEFICDPVY